MISAAQLRAARGLLDWTRGELAEAAKISPETVKNIEHGTFRPQEHTAEAIVRAFAAHDVCFTESDGVQISKQLIKTFFGKNGYVEYLDHIYSILKDGGNIRQFNTSEDVLGYGKEYSKMHLERMSKINNLDARVLVLEGDNNFPANYCSYRWLQPKYTKNIPYYLYGKNVSMFSMKSHEDLEIVSIQSELLTNIFAEQFDWFWNFSAVPTIKKEKVV
jgi:DNA-binding XRE family transcriptional regulator